MQSQSWLALSKSALKDHEPLVNCRRLKMIRISNLTWIEAMWLASTDRRFRFSCFQSRPWNYGGTGLRRPAAHESRATDSFPCVSMQLTGIGFARPKTHNISTRCTDDYPSDKIGIPMESVDCLAIFSWMLENWTSTATFSCRFVFEDRNQSWTFKWFLAMSKCM